jgi:hypothetical protein
MKVVLIRISTLRNHVTCSDDCEPIGVLMNPHVVARTTGGIKVHLVGDGKEAMWRSETARGRNFLESDAFIGREIRVLLAFLSRTLTIWLLFGHPALSEA